MIFASPTPEVSAQERAHAALARRLAGECVVLLENDGALPLAPCKIALFGEGVRHTVKGGTGSGDVYTRSSVTVEEGFAAAGFTIATGAWLDRCAEKDKADRAEYDAMVEAEVQRTGNPHVRIIFELNNPYIRKAPPLITEEDVAASETDTAVYVLTRNSGEGVDRYDRPGDYQLFPEEAQNIALLARAYKRFILVLNIGAVMDLSAIRAIPGVNALVMMGQLGNIGGHALLDALTGAVPPAGRLTDTWAARYADYPSSKTFSHNDGNIDDEPYDEGIYVGYRYFDSFGVQPIYPFGYGKSYTDFDIAVADVRLDADGHTVRAECVVRNTGSQYAGREVVQLYVSSPAGALDKPYQTLAAYGKTRQLAPGESETLEIAFDIADCAAYSEAQSAYLLEKGRYIVRIGRNARDTVACAELVLPRGVTTEQLRPLAGCPRLRELVPAAKECAEQPAISIALDPKKIPSKTVAYSGQAEEMTCARGEKLTLQDVREGRATLEELTAQLSVEEMATLCVGTLRMLGGGNIVGNASHTVPGAAGDTSSIVEASRGVRGLILADGPAGLRLTPHFAIDSEGKVCDDPANMPEDAKHYYQYCTAVPIGWSLAQTWDDALLEQVGDMVGEEMERFGVDLWLAPALNIHRNPLCGRNFEYYSEDPLISGRAAAAITRGVQRHAGRGTTIKHYAANSQEDNRYYSNSIVSERALREIYLKGFEIAVKQAQPLSVMTSYNLINGVHAANHRGILRDVLRDEWGFEGFVMTDWFTSQDASFMVGGSKLYTYSSSAGCIRAGNDVQMPGCQQNVDDIVRAVGEGETVDGYHTTLAELQHATANLLRVVLKAQ